jgi:predicted AlkP superfamily phosphohydrolase/phosphomutase/tetratricopeptide (TPR) repeat protein
MATRLTSKVLLLGWDAADWQVILPLVRAGQMPAVQSLLQNGARGDLQTLLPMVSPLLWNSIATGVRADKHGILHFVEPDPHGPGIRPVGSASRRVKALWNILTQAGLRSHVAGWFASHPAEPINGACISNLFGVPVGPRSQPWPIPPGSVHPPELEATLGGLRVHPEDISSEQLVSFVPQLAEIQPTDQHLVAIRTALAECTTIQQIVSWIVRNESWDFIAAYYNALDHASHYFMPYHPPRREGVPAREFERYKDVMAGFYRYHDQLLGQLLEQCGPDTTVLLVSDHGFHSGVFRPRPPETAPSLWHRALGIFAMAGPGIRKNAGIGKATLLDIAPTVLTLLGLPVGEDMEGRVLQETFAEPVTPERIPSWENVPGESGRCPADAEGDAWQSQAVFQQLIDLGYLPSLNPEDALALKLARQQEKVNRALVYMNSNRPELAAPLLEELTAEEPGNLAFVFHLARCRLGQQQYAESRQMAEAILQKKPAEAGAELILGQVALAEQRYDDALAHLRRAEAVHPQLPELQHQLATAYLRLQRWAEAEQAMQRALAAGSDPVRECLGLAQIGLAQRRFPEAARWAGQAASLDPKQAQAHYFLGVALLFLNRMEEAQQALERCLALDPECIPAYEQLAELHEHVTGDRTRAAELRRRAGELHARAKSSRH